LRFNLAALAAQPFGGVPGAINLRILTDTAVVRATIVPWKPGNLCSITYRGHYGVNTLVYLGYFTPLYQPVLAIPRIVVYLDTMKVPAPAEKALAVGTELRWLSLQKVMALSEEKIGGIQAALAVNGDQYWSFQDTTLPYNEWFSYDSINGSWQSGVKGVRGTYGGCGAGVVYALPVNPLGSSSVMAAPQKTVNSSVARRLGASQAVYTLLGRRVASTQSLGRRGAHSGVLIVVDKSGVRPWFGMGGR
jgi:hypothetical protein